MSKAIDTVWKVSKEFVNGATHVFVEDIRQYSFTDRIKEEIKGYKTFTKKTNRDDVQGIAEAVFYELLGCAVNYQYWYGKGSIRPNGACASKMYKLLDKSFKQGRSDKEFLPLATADFFKWKLAEERYPNVANRIKHIDEVKEKGWEFSTLLASVISKSEESLSELDILLQWFPGFADDIFLKRAFLFFMMLNRRYGWYENCIKKFPVPADYQVPKMLKHWGFISYNRVLTDKIWHGELIPEGSKMECEIRASTIIACKHLARVCDCTMCDIDSYLWDKRDDCDDPFHLTTTTWY